MDSKQRKKYVDFISKQLTEMAKKVKKNSSINESKRENNIFLIFSDKNAKKYMGTGRSFDSQLGTRLQKIAFFAAREKYGKKYVPNIIALRQDDNNIIMSTLSYPCQQGFSQKVYWTDKSAMELANTNVKSFYKKHPEKVDVSSHKIETTHAVIKKIQKEFQERDKKKNGIPIDLFFYTVDRRGNKISAYSYEIKAGGNLDTKNAPSNAKEVKSLETIFSFCDSSIAKFATCYDGKGDGTPDGAIGNHLSRDQIVIGEEFWNEVLEEEVSYDDFIKIYREAYEKAKVEEIIIG